MVGGKLRHEGARDFSAARDKNGPYNSQVKTKRLSEQLG